MGAIGGSGVSIEEALALAGGTLTGPLTIDQNSNADALVIDSEATTASVVRIEAQTTTGQIVNLNNASSLTTGRIVNIVSDSADASSRSLVRIFNIDTAAVGATLLEARQDAANKIIILDHNGTAAGSSYIDFLGAAAANVTGPISTLTTSGATTHHVQIEINGAKAWVAVSTTDPS